MRKWLTWLGVIAVMALLFFTVRGVAGAKTFVSDLAKNPMSPFLGGAGETNKGPDAEAIPGVPQVKEGIKSGDLLQWFWKWNPFI